MTSIQLLQAGNSTGYFATFNRELILLFNGISKYTDNELVEHRVSLRRISANRVNFWIRSIWIWGCT